MKLIILLFAALLDRGVNKAVATVGTVGICELLDGQTFSVTRPIDSSTFTPSSSLDAWAFYTIRINCTASIGNPATGQSTLQFTTDNGANWIDVSQTKNAIAPSLAAVLSINNDQVGVLCGVIPAGTIAKIVTSSTGCTITYLFGQETLK